jgi:hypothetical protein
MCLGSSLETLYLSEEGQPLHLGGGDVLGVGGQEGLAGVHLLHQVLVVGTADQLSLAVRETRKSKNRLRETRKSKNRLRETRKSKNRLRETRKSKIDLGKPGRVK